MADPFCGHVEGRTGCTSYRLFLSCNDSMVVRDDHWRTLRTNLQSVIYLAKGGPKSGDAPYVIPSGTITGGIDRPLHSHLGGQNPSLDKNEGRCLRVPRAFCSCLCLLAICSVLEHLCLRRKEW